MHLKGRTVQPKFQSHRECNQQNLPYLSSQIKMTFYCSFKMDHYYLWRLQQMISWYLAGCRRCGVVCAYPKKNMQGLPECLKKRLLHFWNERGRDFGVLPKQEKRLQQLRREGCRRFQNQIIVQSEIYTKFPKLDIYFIMNFTSLSIIIIQTCYENFIFFANIL
jgi:hypothetical protein